MRGIVVRDAKKKDIELKQIKDTFSKRETSGYVLKSRNQTKQGQDIV